MYYEEYTKNNIFKDIQIWKCFLLSILNEIEKMPHIDSKRKFSRYIRV